MNATRTVRCALLAALAAAGGCANTDPTKGYTTASQFPADVRTVAVPLFRRAAGDSAATSRSASPRPSSSTSSWTPRTR